MNEVGAKFGGPIIKNKLFMFFNYGQYRFQHGPANKLQTIPTTAMLNGDYSTRSSAPAPAVQHLRSRLADAPALPCRSSASPLHPHPVRFYRRR